MVENNKVKYVMDEIMRLTDDGFIVVDTNGIVIDINQKYADFLNHPREEIIGYPITNVIKNSKMPDIVNKRYSEELAVHTYEPGETIENLTSNETSLVLVSRSCVVDENDNVVAGVAQVKFRANTLESAKRLMKEFSELEFYKEEYENSGNVFGFEKMIGTDEKFTELKKEARNAAKTDFSVLITGESGTGKEVFARAIHNTSARANKPLVTVNCAAIPPDLLESELFGYVEGAFTGAKKGGKKGKFQVANGGTIFLDEIGDMPLHMQAKILRVLQENEVDPVGSEKSEPVDVRVISATKMDLEDMVRRGEFREDLYYRLNVINIALIPLRERPNDIPELANYVLYQLNQQYKKSVYLSSDAKFYLSNYSWPGNIRELENVIKAAYATCDGLSIESIDLPARLTHTNMIKPENIKTKTLSEMMDEYEAQLIKTTLKNTSGNCMMAAKVLGINRSSLYKKMDRLNIHQRKEISFD